MLKRSIKLTKHKTQLLGHFSAGRQMFSKLPNPQQVLVRTFTAICALILLSGGVDSLWKPVDHPQYGVSFSYKAATELGVDWKANYIALLDDLRFTRVRLMSYWDLHEPKQGEYDYTVLDYQIDEAEKRDIKVSLSIGLRQPRWPECHEPSWVASLLDESPEWNNALDEYITTTVNRYKDSPALESYQLENESQNSMFGDCNGAAPLDRLAREFALVRALDSSHPVLMSLSDQHGLPVRGISPDAYGFSVYRKVWNGLTPIKFYTTYPTPVWYHRVRKAIIERTKHRPVFIHELQMEPWGPKATRDLSIAEQDKSMSINQIQQNFTFGRKIGTNEIYTWGGEWWYWRKTTLNDSGPWEAVRSELSK